MTQSELFPVPTVPAECWFDHNPTAEVWHCSDAPDEVYPMCERCVAHVRASLALRAAGKDDEANAADQKLGIGTNPMFSRWIDPKPARSSSCGPRTPARIVATITRSLDEMEPEEIIEYALEHLDTPEALEAAYGAVSHVWPGHYANALDFEERLRSAVQHDRASFARLALVPVKPAAMIDGETYLAARVGVSGIAAAIFNGIAAQAKQYPLLFKLEPIR